MCTAVMKLRAGLRSVAATEIVSVGRTDFNTQVLGGEQDVFGYAIGGSLSLASMRIEASGTASSTILSAGLKLLAAAAAISARRFPLASRTCLATPAAGRSSLACRLLRGAARQAARRSLPAAH